MATHSSVLAWRIPGMAGLPSMGSHRVGHDWSDLAAAAAVNVGRSDQIRSVPQSCPTLCDPMNCSTPGLPVHHQLPEFTQPHVHRVSDAIQPSHPLSSPSPPAPNPSQHQGFFPMNQLFAWGGQSTGVSALASFLPSKRRGMISCVPYTYYISI